MVCPKCETVLKITPMSGSVTTFDLLGLQNDIEDFDVLPWVPSSSKNGFDLWIDTGTDTLDDADNPDDSSFEVPQKLGRVTFSKISDRDGTCVADQAGSTGACIGTTLNTYGDGKAGVEVSWVWDSDRYHLARSKGELIYTACDGRDNDAVEISTPADFWDPLTLLNPTGNYRFEILKCGLAERHRFNITDTNIGAGRAGIVDAYFEVFVGLEGCCLHTTQGG